MITWTAALLPTLIRDLELLTIKKRFRSTHTNQFFARSKVGGVQIKSSQLPRDEVRKKALLSGHMEPTLSCFLPPGASEGRRGQRTSLS